MDIEMYVNGVVIKIVKELSKPQNMDIFFAVMTHGVESDDSFMFHFTTEPKTDFDTFCFTMHQVDALLSGLDEATGTPHEPDLRSMSVRYDEYLAAQSTARLDETTSVRFNAIIDQFDDIGWSGSLYGFIMRKVQRAIRKGTLS